MRKNKTWENRLDFVWTLFAPWAVNVAIYRVVVCTQRMVKEIEEAKYKGQGCYLKLKSVRFGQKLVV